MATQFPIVIDTNIRRPITPIRKGLVFYKGDNNANKITVNVFDGNSPLTLTGEIKCYVHRDNGTVVSFDGEVVDGSAQVILKKEAFDVPGGTDVIIKEKQGNNETTIAHVRAYSNDYMPNEDIDTDINIDFIEGINAYMDGTTLVIRTNGGN